MQILDGALPLTIETRGQVGGWTVGSRLREQDKQTPRLEKEFRHLPHELDHTECARGSELLASREASRMGLNFGK